MRLDDGHSTKMSFAADPTVVFWEKTVTPPGIDGGGENDTTTMYNTEWRTKFPKKLKTMTEASMTGAYDPAHYIEAKNLINVNNLITVTFSDGSKIDFWGWLNTFEPQEIVEGEQPEAELGIICSNQDNSKVEVGPVYTPAP